MKMASFLSVSPVFVEIGPDFLKARRGDDGMEVPLERGTDGRITAKGKEKVIAALTAFLKTKSWQPRPRAWCGIGARGVSLRRISLPGGTRNEFHERLLLQIENEFPLPPQELAWGCQPLGLRQPSNGVIGRQDLLVAAVKKEVVADYQEILRASGTDPVFTLAALARWNACGQPASSFAMLDIGATQSELTVFENGVPITSRVVFWDGKDASSAPEAQLNILAQNIRGSLASSLLFVSGNGVSRAFAERLERSLAHGWKCEGLETPKAGGASAAISGLEKFAAGGGPSLAIHLEPARTSAISLEDLDWKTWGTRIGALALAALLLPYAEAFLLKRHLEKKVAAFKTESARLAVIDRELDFLNNLKLSQPPYLDVLDVFAKSVPPGTRFDSLSMNSHGEVSLRCPFRDGQQVAEFSDKLIASGFFTNIVVDEQTPTPDRQRVNVRMSAQETTAVQMQQASARLAAEDSRKEAKPASTDMSRGAPPLPPNLRKASQ